MNKKYYHTVSGIINSLKDADALNPIIEKDIFLEEVTRILDDECLFDVGDDSGDCMDCRVKQMCMLTLFLQNGLKGSIIWQEKP